MPLTGRSSHAQNQLRITLEDNDVLHINTQQNLATLGGTTLTITGMITTVNDDGIALRPLLETCKSGFMVSAVRW